MRLYVEQKLRANWTRHRVPPIWSNGWFIASRTKPMVIAWIPDAIKLKDTGWQVNTVAKPDIKTSCASRLIWTSLRKHTYCYYQLSTTILQLNAVSVTGNQTHTQYDIPSDKCSFLSYLSLLTPSYFILRVALNVVPINNVSLEIRLHGKRAWKWWNEDVWNLLQGKQKKNCEW